MMKWIYGLLALFVLVIIHEFGHFIAAKLLGVKVESFSVGMGPILFHKKIKGTDYRLSLIPLGGYCGMKGEKDFQYAIENNLKEINAEPDSFYGVHPLKRAIIGFTGPFFNFLFVIVALTIINFVGYQYYTYSNKIKVLDTIQINGEEIESPAKIAGLQTGDVITKINNKEVSDFTDIYNEIAINPKEELTFVVIRNDIELEFLINTVIDKSTGVGKIGIQADSQPIVKSTPKYNIFQAFWQGIKGAFENVVVTIKSLGVLFKGVEIKNAVSGPARITDILGSTIEEGFSENFKIGIISILELMSLISVSLFIMNLLPIPILDGGIILIAVIEAITRRKISPKIQYYIQFIGIAFIIFVLIIGLSGDISYFFNKR
ncbi:MAG: site-2 protease family protein [Treponema sp.]|nr:site-2 protease family protein [Treponema sp.]